MNSFDLENIDSNKLYKLHTGHKVFEDSDEGSSLSGSDADESVNIHRPPLYTYEELTANLVADPSKHGNNEIEVDNCDQNWQEIPRSSQGFIREKLVELILPAYCHICPANLNDPTNAKSHYNSNRHKKNLALWKTEQREILKSSSKYTTVEVSNRSSSICSSQILDEFYDEELIELTPEEIIEEELEDWILPEYCYICEASLTSSVNRRSHYNSKRHENKLASWKASELAILRSASNTTAAKLPDQMIVEPLHQPDLEVSNETEEKSLSQPFLDPTSQIVDESLQPQIDEALIHSVSTTQIDSSQSNAYQNTQADKLFDDDSNVITGEKFCGICGVAVKSREDHYNSKAHRWNVDNLCYICYTGRKCKKHPGGKVKNGTQVQKLQESQNLDIPIITPSVGGEDLQIHEISNLSEVKESVPGKWSYCAPCELPLDGIEKAEDHYTSAKHKKKKTTSNGNLEQHSDITNSGPSYALNPPEELDNNIPDLLSDTAIVKRNYEKNLEEGKEPVHCFFCQMTFTTLSELDEHCRDFVHESVVALKSYLQSKGIKKAEYWSALENLIRCTLCDATLINISAVLSHFDAKKHRSRFTCWFETQSRNDTDPNEKWFYCNICSKKLEGTTNAEKHYQEYEHARKATKHATINVQPLYVDSAEFNKSGPEPGPSNFDKNHDEVESVSTTLYDEELIWLKDKVSGQLEEFLDNIYYSKRLPLDLVLKYLQKYNEEVKNMKLKDYTEKQSAPKVLSVTSPDLRTDASCEHGDCLAGRLEDFPADSDSNMTSVSSSSERPKKNISYSYFKLTALGAAGIFLLYLLNKKFHFYPIADMTNKKLGTNFANGSMRLYDFFLDEMHLL